MRETSPVSIPPPAVDGTLELPDGRTLGYAEYGPSDGTPLLMFHGTPGSRYTRVPDTSILDEHGVRQITLERPGFGRSSYDPEREILDWPTDVRDAADALGIDRFAVMGGSGGCPFVLACAARIPDRLRGVGVFGGMGPLHAPGATDGMEFGNRIGFRLARLPLVLRPFIWYRIRKIRRDPAGFIESWGASACEPDERVLGRPEVRAAFCQAFPEAVRQGSKPVVHETRLLARRWGFDLAEIPVHVTLWHGGRDTFTPESMVRHIADEIPSCDLHFYPEDGHLLHYDRWSEMLSRLTHDG